MSCLKKMSIGEYPYFGLVFVMVKKLLDQFCGVGIRSYFLCPVFLPFLKFAIGHIARYAPSFKFQNQQKHRAKLLNLFFHHYFRKKSALMQLKQENNLPFCLTKRITKVA